MAIRTKGYKDLDMVVGIRTNAGSWIELAIDRGKTTPQQRHAMENTIYALMEQKGVPVSFVKDLKGGD